MTLLYLLTGDAYQTSRIFSWFIAILLSACTFIVVRRKYSNLNAVIGALIYPLAPIVFMEARASFTRGLALIFFPLALFFINSLVEHVNKRLRNMLILSVIISMSFITHPMMGFILIVFFTIYIFLRLILDVGLRKASIFFWFASIIIGLGLTSWYLIPFFLEARGWTSISPEFYKALSLPLGKQIILASVSLTAFSIILMFFKRNRNPEKIALIITALISMLFAMGSYVPIVPQLPLVTTVYPVAILLFAIFLLSYLVATGIDFGAVSKRFSLGFRGESVVLCSVVILAVISLPLLESASWNKFSLLSSQPITSQDLRLANKLKPYSNSGRVMPMKYPFSPYVIWSIPTYAQKPMIEGHYFSVTSTGKHIAWLFDALNNGWDSYVFHQLNLWNTRYLPVRSDILNIYKNFLNKLPERGYTRRYADNNFHLYLNKQPSTYLIPLKEKYLVIGKYSMVASSVINSSVQGSSIYLDDYDIETLKRFEGIILYGFSFRDKRKAEDLVTEYSADGGKVVIDLNGYESPLEENPSFLKVTSYLNIAKKAFTFSANESLATSKVPTLYKLPSITEESVDAKLKRTKFKEWRFVTYFGLDKEVASLNKIVNQSKRDYANAAIGYVRNRGNKIWFIGPNMFYHTFASHNKEQIKFLNSLLNDNTRDDRNNPSNYKLLDQKIIPELIRFTYTAGQKLPLFVSVAYSPHWKAYIDGKKNQKIVNLEELMFLDLPPGRHSVIIKYENTLIHTVSKALTFLSLLFIGVLLYNKKYNVWYWGKPKKQLN